MPKDTTALATKPPTELVPERRKLDPPYQPLIQWVEKDIWRLAESYIVHDRRNGLIFIIEKGFLFDIASVPKALWNVCAPFELGGVTPALVHDYLYTKKGKVEILNAQYTTIVEYTKSMADTLFYDLMRETGVSKTKAVIAWKAVATFGGPAWRSDK